MEEHCGMNIPHSGHLYQANGTLYHCPGTG